MFGKSDNVVIHKKIAKMLKKWYIFYFKYDVMKISHRRMSAYCGVANAVYCVHNSSAFLLSKAFDHVSQIRMFGCSRQAS